MPGTATVPPLAPYRVLDLTEGGVNWCGRVLADLGADVIKVEPPGGSPTRRTGPFYGGKPDSERSLFWYAYCLNKRSLTMNLESRDGQEVFKKLAATADIVLESFTPGYMADLGLGYGDLSSINQGLVMTSVTPFGQTGPYSQYKATDIVTWAMGGMEYLTGDRDRPPVRISYPQSQFHAGGQAAAGSMIALWHRNNTGEGQHVDVPIEVAVIWTLMDASPYPPLHKVNMERAGIYNYFKNVDMRSAFPCKDGYVSASIWEGSTLAALVQWMDGEGVLPDRLRGMDPLSWDLSDQVEKGEDVATFVGSIEGDVIDFFADKTKAGLFDRAIENRMLLTPCNTVEDVAEDVQLKARDFWLDVYHPELGANVTHLGPYIKLGETPLQIRRRAPLIGEHNIEIYSDEMGLPVEQIRHATRPSPPSQVSGTRSRRRKADIPVPGGATAGVSRAFEGIKVLDFTWIGVGPVTIKYMADHGATVVHVESVTRPDGLRTAPPYKDGKRGINRSQFAGNFNSNKLGLGLNMAKPEAQELIRKLVADWQPDVVADTFTPRVMKNWGLDYESLKKIKPDIICFSACQQGQTGPHRKFAGFGMQAAAMAGFYHVTGWPDRELSVPYGAYSDFINPPNGISAICAALDYKRRTGKGQRIDLSQFECSTHYLAPPIMDYLLTGNILGRNGNRDEVYCPHGAYPCRDKEFSFDGQKVAKIGGAWCAISITSDEEWQALCDAMDNPAWTTDSRFSSFLNRKKNEDELNRLIGEWTANYEARPLMEMLQEAGVPAGVVQSQSELWEDPQLKHREYFQWLDHTECGPMPYDGLQFHMSKTPGRLLKAQALIGEHNDMILKEFAGLSDDEIAQLIIDEVLETS